MKAPAIIAALKLAGGGSQAMRVRKQVYELTLDDFDKFPVWEFRLEEDGKDESTVRPYSTSGRLIPRNACSSCEPFSLWRMVRGCSAIARHLFGAMTALASWSPSSLL